MFRVQHSRVPAAIAAIAIAATAAGCSSGGNTPASTTGKSTHQTKNVTTTAYTAKQLRGALLTTMNGHKLAEAVEDGAYGALPGIKETRASVKGVKITPARCAGTTGSGLSSAKFNNVPATVASFRVGTNGVSEVLLSPPASMLSSALVRKIPAGCAHYVARLGKHVYRYALKAERAPRIGVAASELNVRASGAQRANIWTVIYRTSNMVGAITLVGTHSTKAQAQALAKQAYQHAAKTLV
jgi:hypothetical protein